VLLVGVHLLKLKLGSGSCAVTGRSGGFYACWGPQVGGRCDSFNRLIYAMMTWWNVSS